MRNTTQTTVFSRLKAALRPALGALGVTFTASLLVLLALYRAGGFVPYTVSPAGYHYGVNNPLEALFPLLPAAAQVYAGQYFLLLRAALAACALCWFLRRHFASECRLLPFLAAAYGVAVYTGCIINVAWVDAAVLLPLLLDAIDHLMRSLDAARPHPARRMGWLVFLCVLLNCYTALPLCVFGFLYLTWQTFLRPGRGDWPHFGKADWPFYRRAAARFGAGLGLGAGGALLCLAPVFWQYLGQGYFHIVPSSRTGSVVFQQIVYCLFYGRYSLQSASEGLPYLYVGMAAFSLALLYFFNGDATRPKFISAFLLTGLAASYLAELPGISWLSGGDVTVFPFRYGFIFSALLLIFAADTLVKGPPEGGSVVASLVFTGIWMLGYKQYAGAAFSAGKLAMAAFLCLASCGFLWLRAHRPDKRRAASAALALLMLADVYASSCITLYGALR